jgi:hypothetical protein
MKQLTIFRIFSFILVPIAALFGIMALLMLLTALANPSLLLIVFIMAAFVIYTFTSLSFLTRGIDTGRPLKPGLRDWIRVNAYVAGFMGIMCLMNVVSLLFMSESDLREFVSKAIAAQPNVPPGLNENLFMTVMKIAAWFLGFVSIILLVHIRINFRLMKLYHHLFREREA